MHRDLPLMLDSRPQRAALAPPASGDALGRLVGRFHPRLAASWLQDRLLLGRYRPAVAVPVILALVALVLFGVMRLGIYNIYGESLIFLVLAVVVGCLSPIVGAALVVGSGLADLVHAVPALVADGDRLGLTDPLDRLRILTGIGGRLVAYLLLWLLVVEIPIVARVAASSPATRWLRERIGPTAVGAAAGVTAGVLAFAWMSAFPLVMRAPFVWAYDTYPNVAAIAPVQYSGWPIVIAAVLAAGAAAYAAAVLLGAQPAEPATASRPASRFGWLVPRLLGLALLAPMITGLIDLLLLLIALIGSPLLARSVWSVRPIASGLQRIPGLVRFLVGYAVIFFIGQRFAEALMYEVTPTLFLPVVISVAIGVAVYDLLFGPPSALIGQRPLPRVAASGVALLLVIC